MLSGQGNELSLLCRLHGTVQYFRSVYAKLRNQVEFFFSVLPSAHAQRATKVNPKWRCPAELTSIHATTPLPYKMLNVHGVHIAPIKFAFRLWRSNYLNS